MSDIVRGTRRDDFIFSWKAEGLRGDDTLVSGDEPSEDLDILLRGQQGDDLIGVTLYDAVNDVLVSGGDGNDSIGSLGGNVRGGNGDDTIRNDRNDPGVISGTVRGGAGNDIITVNALLGADVNDVVYGGEGDDVLDFFIPDDEFDNGGTARLIGGEGADTFGGPNREAIRGGVTVVDFDQAEGDRLALPESLGQRGVKQVVRGIGEDARLIVSFVSGGDLVVYRVLGTDAPLSDDAFV